MAKYLVKETSFVNNMLAHAGDIVDYDLPEGTTISPNLEPVSSSKALKDEKAQEDDTTDQSKGKAKSKA